MERPGPPASRPKIDEINMYAVLDWIRNKKNDDICSFLWICDLLGLNSILIKGEMEAMVDYW